MYAIKQIKICAEYRDMLPRPRLDLSGTPGLRPIGLSPGSWQTSLGLGSMSRYSAQILICITLGTPFSTFWCKVAVREFRRLLSFGRHTSSTDCWGSESSYTSTWAIEQDSQDQCVRPGRWWWGRWYTGAHPTVRVRMMLGQLISEWTLQIRPICMPGCPSVLFNISDGLSISRSWICCSARASGSSVCCFNPRQFTVAPCRRWGSRCRKFISIGLPTCHLSLGYSRVVGHACHFGRACCARFSPPPSFPVVGIHSLVLEDQGLVRQDFSPSVGAVQGGLVVVSISRTGSTFSPPGKRNRLSTQKRLVRVGKSS